MPPLVRVGRLGQVAMKTIRTMNTIINMTYFLRLEYFWFAFPTTIYSTLLSRKVN